MDMIQKFKTAITLIMQFGVIVLILAFILIGLWQIGLVEPPAFLNTIFSDSLNNGTHASDADKALAAFLKDGKLSEDFQVVKAELTPESVRIMLSALEPVKEYVHDLEYTVYATGKSTTNRVVLYYKDELSLAYFVSPTSGAYKQIFEADGMTTISVMDGRRIRTTTFPAGKTSFEAQIGVLTTHKDFLETAEDAAYTYSLISGDDGTLMLITFISQNGDYSQTQTYTLNLDYGVVTHANCYENDKLIYSLSTNVISENGSLNFDIPDEFQSLLPENSMSSLKTAS